MIIFRTLIKNQRDRPSAEDLLNEEFITMHTKVKKFGLIN